MSALLDDIQEQAHRYIEFLNEGNATGMIGCMHDDVTAYIPAGTMRGRKAVGEHIERVITFYPGANTIKLSDPTIFSDDHVSAHATVTCPGFENRQHTASALLIYSGKKGPKPLVTTSHAHWTNTQTLVSLDQAPVIMIKAKFTNMTAMLAHCGDDLPPLSNGVQSLERPGALMIEAPLVSLCYLVEDLVTHGYELFGAASKAFAPRLDYLFGRVAQLQESPLAESGTFGSICRTANWRVRVFVAEERGVKYVTIVVDSRKPYITKGGKLVLARELPDTNMIRPSGFLRITKNMLRHQSFTL